MDRNPARTSPFALAILVACLVGDVSAGIARGADVLGYSVLKGQFLLQTGPSEWLPDPDFGFSILAGVDLTDFDRLESAQIRLPDGNAREPENLGDSWSFLDSFDTLAELDGIYVWGDYLVIFDGVEDGASSCIVEMPETPLPPAPRLVNFDEIQRVDPGKPITLHWEYDEAPRLNDFQQVYVNLGHGEVFATPGWGEPGALTSADRTVTIPAGTLVPGFIHSLNLELTRIVSTNVDCYAHAPGVGAVFRSTELDLPVVTPPVLRLVSVTEAGAATIEVVADPGASVVLQASMDVDLGRWSDISTNSQPTGTNLFSVSGSADVRRFFRARVE